jgi:mono/diheme cytochrome c family protein
MIPRWATTLSILSILGCRVEAAEPAKPAPLTEEEKADAEQALANDCHACHAPELLDQQRLTAKQWEAVLVKMQSWGAPLEPERVPMLVRYLAARHAPDEPIFTPQPVDAKAAALAFSRTADGKIQGGDPKRGRAAYVERCAKCHGEAACGPDGTGADFGVALVEKPILWRAPDFAEIIRRGRGRMPSFEDMQDKDIASILAHLRTLRD